MNPTCIYCRRTKPEKEFTRDHVIPESFGTFGARTWTLPACVCSECNNEWGRKLELFLARDTLEGLMRAEILGARAKPRERDFRLKRLQIRVPDDREYGQFRGLMAAFDWKRRMMLPVPQVIWIDDQTKEPVCASEDDFDQLIAQGAKPRVSPGSIRFYGPQDVARRLAQKAIRFGIAADMIAEWRELQPPERLRTGGDAIFEVTTTVDQTVRRAVAKIAFNYVAYLKGPQYVLGIPFDGIRSFITTGRPKNLVRVERGGSILGDVPEGKRIVAHIVTADSVPERNAIIGRVSLFDVLTYVILLARGIQSDWSSGHVFDPMNRRIVELERRRRPAR